MEGLKPELVGQTLAYKVKRGIFKELASNALDAWEDAQAKKLEKLPRQDFPRVLKDLADSKVRIATIDGTWFSVQRGPGGGWQALPEATKKPIGFTVDQLNLLASGQKLTQRAPYARGILNHLGQKGDDASSIEIPGFVLVIDEINRGNISAIFGELITLLEPDKRIGAKEELHLTLPANQEIFGIPLNLHVLGTMNTADRSVQALDVALRRRFEFVEMPPDPDVLDRLERVVDDLKLSDMLRAINRRLEVLLDRDHTIGHAFFVHVKTLEDLQDAFAHKIIPLLQEFFYGQWNKIGMVLGTGFIQEIKTKAKFKSGFDDGDMSTDSVVYAVTSSRDWTIDTFRGVLD